MANYSFDIVSKTDPQELRNAVDQASKEINNRFDFKGSASKIDYDGGNSLTLQSDDEYKLSQVIDVLENKIIKRGLSIKAFDFTGKKTPASGNTVKLQVPVQNGIEQDQAKQITKMIKDSKLKVQAQIQGDQLRISSTKKDLLQEAIGLIKKADLPFDVQFTNYR